ncbi:MAG: hypothetical protein EXS08_16670 [Planctomycetes bacterium]|nr:hypothetical protein [Planctomycetota bacterium]
MALRRVARFVGAIGLGLCPLLAAQEAQDAAAQIERAQELACRGRHAEARALYKKLAAEFAGTEEGKLAAKRALPSALLGACMLVENGPSAKRVDIVLLGDGFELDHQRAFDELAEDVPPLFERVEPFREYWSYLNFVRGVCLSADGGIDGFGRDYDTLLGGFTLDTDAGHASVDGEKVRDALEQIPGSDALALVFVRLGLLGTAGGGIAVIGGREANTVIHEWGHAFGGLGDEYSSRTSKHRTASAGINVALTDDPKKVPWRHWLEARHPSVGVYEGASGQPMHAWRPTASGCAMNDGQAFCPVCREALVLRLYSIVDPIEEVTPLAPPPGIREPIVLWQDPIEIRVRTLKPATHDLEVRWWIESAGMYPITPGPGGPAEARELIAPTKETPGDRTQRGPLRALPVAPYKEHDTGKDGVATLRLARDDLKPGLYRVTCRVKDTTRLRGERFPWVLKDERGLLESERVWWLEVR